MAVNSAEECQGAHSGVPLLSDGGIRSPKCESDSPVEVPGLMKTHMCFEAPPRQNETSVKVDIMNIYASSILGNDIEQGKLETTKSNDEAVGNLKTEDCLTYFQKVLQRDISLNAGGKFMQLLMNNSLELPKFAPRDKCTTPTSRSRKYKRQTSFNSRRVVFLFSFLSIIGTIILICLTLRVRLIGDASANM